MHQTIGFNFFGQRFNKQQLRHLISKKRIITSEALHNRLAHSH